MTIIGVQQRMMELGRIRMGDKKGSKGSQRKLTAFRLTSASHQLLVAAAAVYGGEVQTWDDAPDEGYFELYTESDELDIILPPVYSQADGTKALPYSQWYELWSAAGCLRRCDGVTEMISGERCQCDPDNRECQITTRLSVMLPRVPGLGTWLLQSKGWNAATVLPGTLDVLLMAAAERQFIPAVLRLEQRTKKVPGEGTRKFVVPVVDVPGIRIDDMLGGGASSTALPSSSVPERRPAEIAAGPPPPEAPEPTAAPPLSSDFGPEPTLDAPTQGESAEPQPSGEEEPDSEPSPPAPPGSDEMANPEDRRGIFDIATQRGVSEERLKEILVEFSGQDSTRELPRHLVDEVISALMQEPMPS